MHDARHSEFILSDARDGWWNEDFLELVATRLRLGDARRLLDVGAGHGHWGQLWAPYLSPEAQLVGIERESRWVERATQRSEELGLAERFTYRQGRAEELPVADASFDVVTCQTLLMHLAKPVAAIREMKRVLAPGGTLLLAEPDNLANLLAGDSVRRAAGLAAQLALVRFQHRCNDGRRALGEGDHAIGQRLPQLLVDEGMLDIRVLLNDRASPSFVGATAHPAHQRALEEKAVNIERRAWLWDRATASRLYRAGGGTLEEFEVDFAAFMDDAERFVSALRAGSYSSAGGAIHYLVSARRS